MKFQKENGLPIRVYEVGDLLYFDGGIIEIIEVDENIMDCKVKLNNEEFWLKESQLDELEVI